MPRPVFDRQKMSCDMGVQQSGLESVIDQLNQNSALKSSPPKPQAGPTYYTLTALRILADLNSRFTQVAIIKSRTVFKASE